MTFTLLRMAAKLAAVAVETDIAGQLAVAKAAVIVQANAKDAIGTYDFGWTPLAESTLAQKALDTPLFESGELKDSIEITMGHHVAWVGTNDDKAEWQELGTPTIPPRSFIRLAAINSEEQIHAMTVQAVGRAFAGHKAGDGATLLHSVKDAAHSIAGIFK